MTSLPLPKLLRAFLIMRGRALLKRLAQQVKEIEALSSHYAGLPDNRLQERLAEIRRLIAGGASPEAIEVPLFAIIRELARRELEMYPYDVQLLAALVLRRHKIVQMETGEGKTLVCPFSAILDVLYQRRVIVITANSYLADRDAKWMAPLYRAAGIATATASSEQGTREKFLAYSAPIVYTSSSDLVFDYLRTQHSLSSDECFPISFQTAIIDEIDNVLLDHGTTPYVLVNPVAMDLSLFPVVARHCTRLTAEQHFTANRKAKTIAFTSSGRELIEHLSSETGVSLPDSFFYVKSILSANYLYERNIDYLVENGELVVIQEFSGRPLRGSTFSFGVHQAIEQKERLDLTAPMATLNRITLQSFYRRFANLGGLSGSAITNALEFKIAYRLDVVPISPRFQSRRADRPDIVYRTKAEQLKAVVLDTQEAVQKGRPVLIGTVSVADAENLAAHTEAAGLDTRLLTARNDYEEAAVIAEAGNSGRVTIAARLAGRGVDILLTEEARTAGGLHIIGVGRAEDRRWDEQLLGRCARQGASGSSVFILSLQDDLLHIFGGQRIQKLMLNLGMTEDVPIESRLITRRIQSAQKQITLQQFFARQTWYTSEHFLDQTRTTVFQRREAILHDLSPRLWAAHVIDLLAGDLMKVDKAKLREVLLEQASKCQLSVPEAFWPLWLQGDQTRIVAEWKRLLLRTYYQRRVAAGLYANARERTILLRSIDYCWSRFLDEVQRKVDECFATIGQRPRVQIAREFSQLFVGDAEKLQADINQMTLHYLMQIHQASSLQVIKYWRGLGVPTSTKWGDSHEDAIVNDGIERPEYAILVVQTSHAFQPRHSDYSLPRPLQVSHTSLRVLVERFLHERAKTAKPSQMQSYKAFLENFLLFVQRDTVGPDQAVTMATGYLEHLRRQGVGRYGRMRQKRCLIRFFRYLHVNGHLQSPARLTVRDSLRHHITRVAEAIHDPFVIVKAFGLLLLLAGYCSLFYVRVPWIVTLSPTQISAILRLPTVVLDLFDGLLSGSNFMRGTIGAAGLLPMLLMRLCLRLGGTRSPGSPILCIPFSVVVGATLTAFYSAIASAGVMSLRRMAVCFGLLVAGAQMIAVGSWLAEFLDISDGFTWLLLINGVILLSRWLYSSGARIVDIPWPYALSALACFLGLFYLYRRYSVARICAIHIGHFDFDAGQVGAKPVTLRLRTMVDYQHYLYSIILIAILIPWLQGQHLFYYGNITTEGNAIMACYLILVWLLTYRNIQYHLGFDRIDGFLESRGMLPASGRSIKNLVLQRWIWVGRNCGFEGAIALMLWLLLQLATWRSPDPNLASVIFVSVVSLVCYIAVDMASEMKGLLSPIQAGFEITIPDSEHNDVEGWLRRFVRKVQDQRGWIGIIVIVAGCLQFFDYTYRAIVWLIGRLR